MLDLLEKIPYLVWFSLGLVLLTILVKKEQGIVKANKPTYEELEQINGEKTNSNSDIVSTAASIYVFKFWFKFWSTLIAFILVFLLLFFTSH